MTEIAIIARYGKDHGLTYGQVSLMLAEGKLTHEEVGIVRKEEKKKNEAGRAPVRRKKT